MPREFTVHPKLVRQIGRRRNALGSDDPAIEWGHAESLAFAALLRDAVPIRLTGQDTVRGTFSQRHQVLVDASTDATWTPMHHIKGSRASFEIHNSPLSEYACLGFEYGYAVTVPDALVLWEAQFGDFVNGAEIVVDQFIIAGLAKWRQTSRLTLLLPHGYEGQGPNTRARGWSASWPWARRATSGSPTPPPRPSTSTSCGGRVSTEPGRWWS